MLDVTVMMAIAVTYSLVLHGWFSRRLEDLEIGGLLLPFGDDGDDGFETLHVAAWKWVLSVDVGC